MTAPPLHRLVASFITLTLRTVSRLQEIDCLVAPLVAIIEKTSMNYKISHYINTYNYIIV